MVKTIFVLFFLFNTSAFAKIDLKKGDVVLARTGLVPSYIMPGAPYEVSAVWGTIEGVHTDKHSNTTIEVKSFDGKSYTLPYKPFLLFKKVDDAGQIVPLSSESISMVTKYIDTYVGKDHGARTENLRNNEWQVLALVRDQDPNSRKTLIILINKNKEIFYMEISANTIFGSAINGYLSSDLYYPYIGSDSLPALSKDKCIQGICIGDLHLFAVSLDNEMNRHQDFLGLKVQSLGEDSRTYDSYTGLGKVIDLYYSETLELLYIRFIDSDGKERVAPKSSILKKTTATSVIHRAGLVDPESLLVTYGIGEDVSVQPYYAKKHLNGCKIKSFNTYPFVDYMFGYENYSSKASTSNPFKTEEDLIAELDCSGEIIFVAIKNLMKTSLNTCGKYLK